MFLAFRRYEAMSFTCFFCGSNPLKTSVWLHFEGRECSQTVVLEAPRLQNHVFYDGLEAPKPCFLGLEAVKPRILHGFVAFWQPIAFNHCVPVGHMSSEAV